MNETWYTVPKKLQKRLNVEDLKMRIYKTSYNLTFQKTFPKQAVI